VTTNAKNEVHSVRLEHQTRRLRNLLADAICRGCPRQVKTRLEHSLTQRWALLENARKPKCAS